MTGVRGVLRSSMCSTCRPSFFFSLPAMRLRYLCYEDAAIVLALRRVQCAFLKIPPDRRGDPAHRVTADHADTDGNRLGDAGAQRAERDRVLAPEKAVRQ